MAFLRHLGASALVVILSPLAVVGPVAVQEPRPSATAAAPGGPGLQEAMKLLAAQDPSAIPSLRSVFEKNTDELQRKRAAFYLVALGVEDRIYYEVLAGPAQEAVESPIPTPFGYNDNDAGAGGGLSSELLAWCEKHKKDPMQVAQQAVYAIPAKLMLLSRTGDPRAFDLFVQGLHSPNALVVGRAAIGLGWIGDERALQPLLAASRRMPAELRITVVQSLLILDTEEALKAARQLSAEVAAATGRDADSFEDLQRIVAKERKEFQKLRSLFESDEP